MATTAVTISSSRQGAKKLLTQLTTSAGSITSRGISRSAGIAQKKLLFSTKAVPQEQPAAAEASFNDGKR